MNRIAIDIGGTFTDLAYMDDVSMQMVFDKTRSTPEDVGQAVIDVIK